MLLKNINCKLYRFYNDTYEVLEAIEVRLWKLKRPITGIRINKQNVEGIVKSTSF
jgi:hypothetical protein